MDNVNPRDASEDEVWRRAGERGTPFDNQETVKKRVLGTLRKAVRLRDIGKVESLTKNEETGEDELGVWSL